MSTNVIEIQDLSRKFGNETALQNVTLDIRQGGVLGLVGENGAGKTTLLKHTLGLFKAQQGSVRVFGLDPVLHPVEVLSQIGYLSENQDRKSTRLNSSHVVISYAVFCLKKKTQTNHH